MFELFFRPPGMYDNLRLEAEMSHTLRLKTLEESDLPIASIVSGMLSRDAKERPTMDELASLPIWPTPASANTVPAGLKRLRDSEVL
jgi:hypothetical protein